MNDTSNKRNRARGFSLIELMIVLVIVAILAAIAFPAYQNQVQKTRRADAKTALTGMAQTLERCYTQYNAYDDSNCAVVDGSGNISATSDEGYYAIDDTTLNASQYTIRAQPATGSPQNDDDDCQVFTLSSTGQKQAEDGASNDTTDTCW